MDKERLIFLHHCEALTWNQLRSIVVADPELRTVFSMDIRRLKMSYGLSELTAKRLYQHMKQNNSTYIMKNLIRQSISAVTIFDENYPPLLKNIYDPPWVLYGQGDWTVLNRDKMISVVGTRNPSNQGKQALQKVLGPLLDDKWVVISGLAKGIDTFAHELSIQSKSLTAAVLGSGLLQIYPKENRVLAKKISEQGILLSEFSPQVTPKRWHFPLRNRIISGLTRATLVAEARTKSGSLITADQALEQGRDVFAIPGSILEECANGTNFLIQNGAKLVMSAEDIQNESF
ncbi:DNA processing protein [Fictibacillus halophilus]|uniref:DNA processing protein n=1 Tax=Fictibacillus halophilus TaxID=1610490 RepID=A0ABV2LJJ3_9BACL|nr:DNA-processing protein DprA [Fictibacillus halophilus]